MPEYRIVVSEITNFGDLRCVAGWDIDRGKMIRPEPHPRGFWPPGRLAPAAPFEIKSIVRFKGLKPVPATEYPHLTEDRVVTGTVLKEEELDQSAYHQMLRPFAFSSLQELFDGNLIIDGSKAYVPTGAKCRSLGGLEIPAKGTVIEPYVNYEGKSRLRLRFLDESGYLAPNLTSSLGYAAHAAGKIDGVNANLAKASRLLLRIGLARGFGRLKDRCYLQVNGLSLIT